MERGSIYDDVDLSGFAPKAPDPAPPAAEVRAVSKGFPSREVEPKREVRTYRTGRNTQFNVKASKEVIAEFYAISDQQGWVLGETLERALEALREKLR